MTAAERRKAILDHIRSHLPPGSSISGYAAEPDLIDVKASLIVLPATVRVNSAEGWVVIHAGQCPEAGPATVCRFAEELEDLAAWAEDLEMFVEGIVGREEVPPS